ncbi:hypothetical protein GCM10022207_25540 [Streptomyces lannensis]|uniref:Uncharacterized protein n=2 Tax=Streptomyces TaxID=1883 RepID=A0ABP7JZY5_9ACTN
MHRSRMKVQARPFMRVPLLLLFQPLLGHPPASSLGVGVFQRACCGVPIAPCEPGIRAHLI